MRRREYKEKPSANRSSDSFFKPVVQKKLSVGKPGDKFEKEADSVADKVVNKTTGSAAVQQGEAGSGIQQKPLAEGISSVQAKELEKEDTVQKAPEKMEDEQKVQPKEEEKKDDPTLQKKEEEEKVPIQQAAEKKEDEQKNQPKEEEKKDDPTLQKKEEEEKVPIQQAAEKKEDEQKIQPKEEEKKDDPTLQKKEEEEKVPIQQVAEKKEDEQKIQPKEEEKKDDTLQQKSDDEEKPMQQKGEGQTTTAATEKKLSASKGSGSPMDAELLARMESGFGTDLNDVRIHTDANAEQMSKGMSAQAFTHGNDIYFNKGKYNPGSKEGERLIAHEITHTIQQKGGGAVQKKHAPDTGWRYTLPATVTRSVIEIQGIVNATPDGVYGVDTKNAVEDYQRVLKSAGLYSGDIDGKWGALTDVAHASYALRRPYRAGYNCAGFAFKRFSWVDYLPTKSILAGMTKLAGHSSKTSPYHYKFWFWDIKVAVKDKFTGVTSPVSDDFHIVGGQTDGKGEGPDKVMSKNGERPVEGPKSPLDWEVKSGPALDQDGNALSRYDWVISSSKLSVHSNKDLP